MQYRTNTYLVNVLVLPSSFITKPEPIPAQLIIHVENVCAESTTEFYAENLFGKVYKVAAEKMNCTVGKENCIVNGLAILDSAPQEAYIPPATNNQQLPTEN